MSDKKRQLEDYWGRCWAVPLGQHLAAEVHPRRPFDDPPDIDFRIERPDGTVLTSWGEVTGAYHDATEAEWLWGSESKDAARLYFGPNAMMAARARERVERKRGMYESLVRRYGRGHLLVLLHSLSTTRSTRVAAEESILALMETGPPPNLAPFETVWLGYQLGITTRREEEHPEYAFRDAPDSNRVNFLKCIWTHPPPVCTSEHEPRARSAAAP